MCVCMSEGERAGCDSLCMRGHSFPFSVPCSPSQIPEYCQTLDEEAVLENSFDLIFAFDEIVALGYRESVNLAQIRTFTGGL